MNSSDFDRNALLQDLFESPREEVILRALRREKVVRRRRRLAIATAVPIIAIVIAVLSMPSRVPEEPSRPLASGAQATETAKEKETGDATVPMHEPSTFQVEHIDDRELLALFEGHPVALVRLPTGQQTLLMIVQSAENKNRHSQPN